LDEDDVAGAEETLGAGVGAGAGDCASAVPAIKVDATRPIAKCFASMAILRVEKGMSLSIRKGGGGSGGTLVES
jgi:hypothetical protein